MAGGPLDRDKEKTADEIIAHYKCPRHAVFADLPKTSTGKIQKYVLWEMAKAV